MPFTRTLSLPKAQAPVDKALLAMSTLTSHMTTQLLTKLLHFAVRARNSTLQTSNREGIEVGARLPREHPVTAPRDERWRQFERYPLSLELTRCWHVPSLLMRILRHVCPLMMTQPSGMCGCTVLEVMACVAYVATYKGPLRLSQLDLCVSVCVTEYRKRQLACSRTPSLVPRPPPHPQAEIFKKYALW